MNKPKVMKGVIVSMKTPNTVIVTVVNVWRHPLYKKAIRRTRRFAAHYESLTLAMGDAVEIRESKPISRTKHFVITKKLN